MQIKLTKVFIVCICICSGMRLYGQQLIKQWQTDSVFKVPESVLFDKANHVLYVSNIDGKDPWGADGAGSVGKMNADGTNINAEWVKGLQAPKGMGLYKGKLYVADLKEVVVIDIAAVVIQKRILVEGAVGLNDISIDSKGTVYVTDSKAKRLYRIINEKTELLLDTLKAPNGVLAHKQNLFILDAGNLYKINEDKSLTIIAAGMEGGTDGVEIINGKDFIVSTWGGVIYYVKSNGEKKILVDGRDAKINSADIGLDAKNKILFVPTFWKNTVTAYLLK
jgi:DNA-binding beta-propeller fold protein YncE